jgi:hypothetical protein
MSDHNEVRGQLMALAEGFMALRTQMERTGHAFVAFGYALYGDAERAYLHAHGRLPGSTTTARLRKKRQALVWRWYMAQLERVRGAQEGHADG